MQNLQKPVKFANWRKSLDMIDLVDLEAKMMENFCKNQEFYIKKVIHF